jgi:DNA-binding transcriptional ArsR family regulator
MYNQMVVRYDSEHEEALDQLFRALADRTRRDILRRTMVGEASISTLAADYAMSIAAVQKHVAVLEAAGLVVKSPQGRERVVRAEPERVAEARAALAELEALWHHRLSRLDELFAEDPPSRCKEP